MFNYKSHNHLILLSLYLLLISLSTSLLAQDFNIPTPTSTMDLATAPLVFIPESKFDFGEVEEGPNISHVFKISNRGHSTLEYFDPKVTNVVIAYKTPPTRLKGEILPGGQGGITVTYHTKGRPGHCTKIINLKTNDPLHPEIQFKIDMTVFQEVDVLPDKVYFYGIKHGEEHGSQVKILGRPGKPLEVLSVETTRKVVTVTSTPYSEGDGNQKRSGATLNVTIPRTQPIGAITDDLMVKTTSAKNPRLDIQVLGEVVGRVQWSPKSVYFGANQELPVFVNITANPPQGFAMKRVSSVKHLCRPFLKTVTNQDGSMGYQLGIVAARNIPKDSDGKDQVVAITNDPETPEFKVDVQTSP